MVQQVKGACLLIKFDPCSPHGGKRTTLSSCPLTRIQSQTHTVINNINYIKKTQCFLLLCVLQSVKEDIYGIKHIYMVGSILEYDTPKFQIMKEKDRQRELHQNENFCVSKASN